MTWTAIYRWRYIAVPAFLIGAMAAVFFDAATPIRTVTVVPVILLCPGFAIGAALPLEGPATVLRLTVPISLAVSLLIAQILLTMHHFEPKLGLSLICAISLLGVLCDLARRRS